MNIGLDYDDTYTRDPELWDFFIARARLKGHNVYIVTWRFACELVPVFDALGSKVDGIYPTGRLAKEKFMFSKGVRIDVWIDDNPSAILRSMEGYQS